MHYKMTCFNTVFEELRETRTQLKKVSADYEGEQIRILG